MISEELEKEVKALVEAGCSARKAARITGVSRSIATAIASGRRKRAARQEKRCVKCGDVFSAWPNQDTCDVCKFAKRKRGEFEVLSEEEIRCRAAEIRKDWTERTYRERAQLSTKPYEFPVVSASLDER